MGDPTYAEDVTIGSSHRTYSDPLDQAKHTTVGFSTGTETTVPRSGALDSGEATDNSFLFRDNRAGVNGHPVCSVSEYNQMVIDDEESRRQHLNHKVARSRIKAAIYEFYRSMEMLKNYKVIIARVRWRLVCLCVGCNF